MQAIRARMPGAAARRPAVGASAYAPTRVRVSWSAATVRRRA